METGLARSEVLIFGTGAIGGFYAFILSSASQARVEVVARSNDHALQQKGLQIRSSEHGDHVIRLERVYRNSMEAATASKREYDFVVVATKTIDQDSTAEDIVPVVGADTTIVLLQDGIGIEDAFRRRFPGNRILSCVAWTLVKQIEPGIVQYIGAELLQIGLFQNPELDPYFDKDALDAFVRVLREASAKFKIEENIQVRRWEKWIGNIGSNSLTTLTGLTTTAWIQSSSEALLISRSLFREAVHIARASRVDVSLSSFERYVRMLKERESLSRMQVDARDGSLLEIESMFGVPVKKARDMGIRVPVLETIYALLLGVNARIISRL